MRLLADISFSHATLHSSNCTDFNLPLHSVWALLPPQVATKCGGGVLWVAEDIACKSPSLLLALKWPLLQFLSEGKLRLPTWLHVALPGNCFSLTKQVNKHFCGVCSGRPESNNCTTVALFVSP